MGPHEPGVLLVTVPDQDTSAYLIEGWWYPWTWAAAGGLLSLAAESWGYLWIQPSQLHLRLPMHHPLPVLGSPSAPSMPRLTMSDLLRP